MTRPAPRSTLFPYTTLFRSTLALLTGQAKFVDDMSLPGMVWMAVVRSPYAHAGITSVDRKSTRLNSSHVKISYAVFCLKNKKIIIRKRQTLQFTFACL